MSRKSDLPAVPPALADVAVTAAPAIAAAAALSLSKWLELVRLGDAPQPVIREPRYTRWLVTDIRRWLVERSERGSAAAATQSLVVNARRASGIAKAKRVAARSGA